MDWWAIGAVTELVYINFYSFCHSFLFEPVTNLDRAISMPFETELDLAGLLIPANSTNGHRRCP